MRAEINSVARKGRLLIHGLIATMKFTIFTLFSGICFKNTPEASLELLRTFIKVTKDYYPNNLVTGRTLNKSQELLSALITKYSRDKSFSVLQQLLLVYQEEFLRRNYGRK